MLEIPFDVIPPGMCIDGEQQPVINNIKNIIIQNWENYHNLFEHRANHINNKTLQFIVLLLAQQILSLNRKSAWFIFTQDQNKNKK